MNSRKQLTTLIGLGIMILLSGCATDQNHKYMPHNKKSYVVRGHNYSFAIYNGEHRLLTHPVEDLLAEMKWRKSLDKPAISDIYLVSHGWNYTLPVAIANYHNYMERIDKLMASGKPPTQFQPYFIFVTWTSTTRPTTDLAKAVLPFGIDTAAEPFTSVIDKVPLHILTAWKQSLNAAQNALGPRYPNYYLNKDWKDRAYGYLDTTFIQDADATMGEDVPVSALIYQLIKQKRVPSEKEKELSPNCYKPNKPNRPDPLNPDDDACVPLIDTKLHLVGHSYGAKLVTMAGMEALRRWMLEYISAHPNEFKAELKELAISDQTKKEPTELLKDLAISEQTGHRFVGKEVRDIFKGASPKPPLLKAWYNQNQSIPIDSLVLFNPALHPGELSYPVSELISAPTETLRLIPRKAVVYTTHDYANGALFGLRESILNAQLTQWYHSLLSDFNQEIVERTKDKEWYFQAPLLGISKLGQATLGTLSLGYSFLYTQIGQAFYSTVNLPMDFWLHVQTGTLDGWFEQKSDSELSFIGFGKNLANGVDFFLPIKLTRMFGNPTQGLSLNSPLVFQRDEAEQGLFRLSRPGLGKTGLNHLTEGRWTEANLWGLANYYCDPSDKESCQKEGYGVEQLKNIDLEARTSLAEFTPFAPNIDPETFCRFNAKPFLTTEGFKSDFKPEKLRWLREKFYSFDASKIYDSQTPPAGAHSDLRETKEPSADNCWNESKECQRLEKRDYTFNFMLNFTKTDFEQELCELNPKEMQKYGVICSPKESGK